MKNMRENLNKNAETSSDYVNNHSKDDDENDDIDNDDDEGSNNNNLVADEDDLSKTLVSFQDSDFAVGGAAASVTASATATVSGVEASAGADTGDNADADAALTGGAGPKSGNDDAEQLSGVEVDADGQNGGDDPVQVDKDDEEDFLKGKTADSSRR